MHLMNLNSIPHHPLNTTNIYSTLLFIVLYCIVVLFCFLQMLCMLCLASCLSVRPSVCAPAPPFLFLFYSTPYLSVNGNTERREIYCKIYHTIPSILFYIIPPPLFFSFLVFDLTLISVVSCHLQWLISRLPL